MGRDLKSGVYIPNISSAWLYHENIEKGNYIVKEKYLDKLLSGKMDFSMELLENKVLLDNINIIEKDGKLYTLDIVNVTYQDVYVKKEDENIVERKTTKQLRDWTYIEGFTFNNKKFSNWKRSSGKAREGECLFVLDSIVDKCLDWARMGLDFTGNVDITSVRAYESLTLSSIIYSIELDPKNILVIDDYNSVFNWEMSKTELINKELVTETGLVEESNSIWDGQGLMDVSVFNDNELINGKGMALLRQRYFKCCTFSANLSQFYKDYCKENGLDYNTYSVKDIHNNSVLVKDIKLITTPNSIKIEKFNDKVLKIEGYKELGKRAWLKYWKDNISNNFGVCKFDEPSRFDNGKYNRLSYQKINTIPFTRQEVTDIAKREIDYIEQLKDDLDFFMQEAKIYKDVEFIDMEEIEDYIIKGRNIDVTSAFVELVKTNEDFANTQVFKDYRRNFISAKIKELRQGKIRVEGDYMTICGNPIEMLYATVRGFKGQSIELVGNQVYCPKFANGEVITGFRDPHICTGNIANLINIENDTISKYMNCTDNIVIVNSIDYPLLTILQGQDFDSDTMLITNNKTIVGACSRLNLDNTPIPTNGISSTGRNNKEMNGKNMADIDHTISQNYIGQDVNLSQELNSLMNHLEYNGQLDDDKREEIYNNISKCSSISCVEIDKAKKQFQDLNVPRELEKIKEGMERVSSTDNRCIKPYFFKFTGDTKAQKQRLQVNQAHKRELDNETIKKFAIANNIDIENVDMSDKRLVKLLKKNTDIQKTWEEEGYKIMDTPMDWLQEELDTIKDANSTATIQVIQLVKKSKHKADEKIVASVVKKIRDLDTKVKGYRLDLELDYNVKQSKITREKNKVSKEISEMKLTKANMTGILKVCLNSVKKNENLNKRSNIESLTLEVLFKAYGKGLLSMFER